MLRKLTLVLIGAIAIAFVALSTGDASARGGWRGGHGHGWHGYRGGYYGFRSYGYPYYGSPYYAAAYGCYRTVRVGTPYGCTWQRDWVCG